MTDFWRSSGFHLLRRDANRHLAITDDYLRAYFLRPELRPVEESCDAEIALHAELVHDPKIRVHEHRIAALADPDARENYRVMLTFRDLLLRNGTVEACYLDVFRQGAVRIPPLFVDQMAHVILRSVLDGCDKPLRLRAGELFFRTQKVSLPEGSIMLADEETVDMHATTGGFGDLGRLIAEAGTDMRSIDLDVLNEDNAHTYWDRDERYDFVLDLSFERPGLNALCRVLEAWIAHFVAAEVTIEPVGMIRDERWIWHIGLDATSTAILNDLYSGTEVGEDRLRQLLSLFRLEFRDPALMRSDIAGRPVYLGLAMDGGAVLRMKPQNVLVNLPLSREI